MATTGGSTPGHLCDALLSPDELSTSVEGSDGLSTSRVGAYFDVHQGSPPDDDKSVNPLLETNLPASLERKAFGVQLDYKRSHPGAFSLPPELRDPPTLLERIRKQFRPPDDIPRTSLYQYGLLVVYMTCPMLGMLLPMPLLIFAQTKFFNNNTDCVTPQQTDSHECKAAMASVNEVQSIA